MQDGLLDLERGNREIGDGAEWQAVLSCGEGSLGFDSGLIVR